MKNKKLITVILAAIMTVGITGCASKKAEAPAGGSNAPASTEAKKTNLSGSVTFGVVAPITGTNKMVGEYVLNGAKLAVKEINENGGILGKELKIVTEDEVDNLQASVNAMTKIMNYPDVSAFFGSTYSQNDIAVAPVVLEKKITMFAGGSSANIPKLNNPYIWQARMTDDNSGKLLAKAATQNLKMKNPAILYSTDSFGTGLQNQTVSALKDLGITVKESNLYGFATDEKNYTPLISRIQNSDADGIIAIANQMPAALICQQVEASGYDKPLLGSSSWASAVARQNAGASADGWNAVADWTVEVSTDAGKKFEKAYEAAYGKESDMPAVTAYDSIMLFKKACEIAKTTTDKEAINNALKQIKDYPGAMSTYTAADNRCFSTSQFLTLNKNGKATMLDTVKKQ